MRHYILSSLALLTAALASPVHIETPTPPRHTAIVHRRSEYAHALTAADLIAIAPTSSSCIGAPYPSECRTAAQALPHIQASFSVYNITHGAVRAALVSLMAYESGEFKYNVNHFPAPGTPGQGTRNMQSTEFNEEYARDLGFGPEVWDAADPGTLMAAVGRDEYSFASAAWFVVSQCRLEVRRAMWDGSRAGWEAYLTRCVGTSVDEARVEYWERAMRVFVG